MTNTCSFLKLNICQKLLCQWRILNICLNEFETENSHYKITINPYIITASDFLIAAVSHLNQLANLSSSYEIDVQLNNVVVYWEPVYGSEEASFKLNFIIVCK